MKLTRAAVGDPKYVRPLEAEHLEMLLVEPELDLLTRATRMTARE
jgi:hypothetical protein